MTSLSSRADYGKRKGKVFINGRQGDLSSFKKLIGFVPQDDIMLSTMTVKETLLFSAYTRLPTELSREGKKNIVNSVLKLLGLWEIRHELIGDELTRGEHSNLKPKILCVSQTSEGISGGQKKRVNIAIELVSDPTVLFLDEPTSGLDSTSSKEVIGAMSKSEFLIILEEKLIFTKIIDSQRRMR